MAAAVETEEMLAPGPTEKAKERVQAPVWLLAQILQWARATAEMAEREAKEEMPAMASVLKAEAAVPSAEESITLATLALPIPL